VICEWFVIVTLLRLLMMFLFVLPHVEPRAVSKCVRPMSHVQLCHAALLQNSCSVTELQRIEQRSIRKKSCATVKRLSDTPCHTCNFVAEHELRDKVAGVTSV